MTVRNLIRSMLDLILVVLFSASTSLPAQSKQDEKDPAWVKRGRALYVQYCIACHGPSGKGDGPVAAAFKEPPADLTTISYRYKGFPTDRVMNWIDGEKAGTPHGTREMPVWGKRFRQEKGSGGALGDVYALSQYVKSIQK